METSQIARNQVYHSNFFPHKATSLGVSASQIWRDLTPVFTLIRRIEEPGTRLRIVIIFCHRITRHCESLVPKFYPLSCSVWACMDDYLEDLLTNLCFHNLFNTSARQLLISFRAKGLIITVCYFAPNR